MIGKQNTEQPSCVQTDKQDVDLCPGTWDPAQGSVFYKRCRQRSLPCSGLHLLMFSTEPSPCFRVQAASWYFIVGCQCITNEHLAWVNKCNNKLAFKKNFFFTLITFSGKNQWYHSSSGVQRGLSQLHFTKELEITKEPGMEALKAMWHQRGLSGRWSASSVPICRQLCTVWRILHILFYIFIYLFF